MWRRQSCLQVFERKQDYLCVEGAAVSVRRLGDLEIALLEMTLAGTIACVTRRLDFILPITAMTCYRLPALLCRKRPATQLTAAQSRRAIGNGPNRQRPGSLHEMFRRMQFRSQACVLA